MLKTLSQKGSFYSNLLSHCKVAYCSKPYKVDFQPHRAKPEDIPEGIWDEDKHSKFTGVEEVKDRWHYVERLFPKIRIPEPPKNESSTGWKAPSETVPDLPFFVKRTRNHMLPVYLGRMYKDRVLVTQVRYVHGDIYLFENNLKSHLEEIVGETLESNVNEMALRVNFRGDYKNLIEQWLYSKGF